MQFLYFYVPGPDNGTELRCSIRSVEQNFVGETHITVIGDKPDWFKGHHIPLAPVPGKTQIGVTAAFRHRPAKPIYRTIPEQTRQFRDTQNKIFTAVNHPEIHDEFVHIMDDVFLLRPTTIEELMVPRIDPWYKPLRTTPWHKNIWETFMALRAKGKPELQYGTHLPHHFIKGWLQELFLLYEYPRKLLLFEILYGNHFRTDPIPYGGTPWNGVQYPQFLKRILKRPKNMAEMDSIVSQSAALNWQAPVYNPQMKTWLENRFPIPSSVE